MGELVGIARFRFHPGKVEEYKRLSAQAMDIVRAKERGTLEYSIYLNKDESEAVVIERFESSEALLEHGANMSEISAAVLKTGTVEGGAPRRSEPGASRKADRTRAGAVHAVPVAEAAIGRPRLAACQHVA